MIIVADENIPFAAEAFGKLGEVRLLPGRGITQADLRDADLLMVRSITQVNPDLLAGTKVRFVGTATIGTDHIDTAYLQSADIGFSSAPGCNANSVAEYITAVLLELQQRHRLDFASTRLGIVGVGNVGSRVQIKAEALGIECVLCDPPRARATGDPRFRPIDEIYACDIITTHVPLERGGTDPTYHLVDEAFLAQLSPDTILINTARGAVMDNAALLHALREQRLRDIVLDVWEGEPLPNPELLEKTAIATPHIAGYSFDGKVNGTTMIYEAACAHLGVATDWDPTPLLPPAPHPELQLDSDDALTRSVCAAYAIMEDDAALRAQSAQPEADRAAYFDNLRKKYRRRREFPSMHLTLRGPAQRHAAMLRNLGFRCTTL